MLRGHTTLKVPRHQRYAARVRRHSGDTQLPYDPLMGMGIIMLNRDHSTIVLQGGEEQAAAAFSDAVANLQAIEREISAAEERVWQPHWSKSDPLAERLRRVGVTDATANMLMCLIQGWD